jgi:hypothetical protein
MCLVWSSNGRSELPSQLNTDEYLRMRYKFYAQLRTDELLRRFPSKILLCLTSPRALAVLRAYFVERLILSKAL